MMKKVFLQKKFCEASVGNVLKTRDYVKHANDKTPALMELAFQNEESDSEHNKKQSSFQRVVSARGEEKSPESDLGGSLMMSVLDTEWRDYLGT